MRRLAYMIVKPSMDRCDSQPLLGDPTEIVHGVIISLRGGLLDPGDGGGLVLTHHQPFLIASPNKQLGDRITSLRSARQSA